MHAVNVYLPKDRVTNQHQGYGFVEYQGEEDADYVRPNLLWPTCSCMMQVTCVYTLHLMPSWALAEQFLDQLIWHKTYGRMLGTQAMKILNMIKLYGKPIRVNKASSDKKTLEVGANLFIGNLDPEVDEKVLE